MQPTISQVPSKCSRLLAKCDLVAASTAARPPRVQHFSTSSIRQDETSTRPSQPSNGEKKEEKQREPGAMSLRLAQMTEEGLESSGRRAAKVVQEAGFDEDLKRELEERIKGANFRNEYASAFAQAELPSYAGRGTRDIAGARAWDGTETVEDVSLRMLDDSIKPMRGPSKRPLSPAVRMPAKVDTGRSTSKPQVGARLANARDKTSIYASFKDIPDEEREKFRKEMKERFSPAARSAPVTVVGLESLANERIEDAIARGKFKNLPRGQKIERDYNASSPFINTTEYLLNRMIQRQDIVPPWIEKQQELLSAANRFRGRLREEWRRHAARTISSKGGSLASQIALAEEYALAETIYNPQPKKKSEKINTVDEGGHLSQITVAGELKPGDTASTKEKAQELKVTQETIDESGEVVKSQDVANVTLEPSLPTTSAAEVPGAAKQTPSVRPFRDPNWLRLELSFQKLSIENLNNLTRSYNLMCPQLAQRPYFDLERELNACYADVAPQIAKEINDRASAPTMRYKSYNSKPPSRLESFVGSQAKVYDEVRPQYGFKELLKDWFRRDKGAN